jgi:hypothetical protein
MARTPTSAQLKFVGERTRALVRSQRPFVSQFWGMSGAPLNTTAPVVTGTGTVGQTLSCTQGVWTNSPTGYAYQWLRNGTNIAGATAATRVLAAVDAGTNVSCRVTATNAGGSTPAVSNAIAVTVAPPANTTAPVATSAGSTPAALGDVINVTNGAWSGAPTSYAYQWLRNGTNIAGQTTNAHTVVALDAGTNVSCRVTATNAGGAGTPVVSNVVACA